MNLEKEKTRVLAFVNVRPQTVLLNILCLSSHGWALVLSPRAAELHPFLSMQRADEIKEVYPWVAYYCRKYALEEVGLQ